MGSIKSVLRYVAIKSGVAKYQRLKGDKSDNGRRRNDVRILHGHRKFFDTTLILNDVEYIFKELLMGHSVKLDNSYFGKFSQKSQNKALQEYLKAFDALTINEENRLKAENRLLKEEKETKLSQLQNQVTRLERFITQEKVSPTRTEVRIQDIIREY